MNPENPILPANNFKDRKSGMMVFGILTLLMGGICMLFAFLMIVGQIFFPKGSAPQPESQLAFVAVIYTALGAALIWMGVGSIIIRRWARALLLIFSWSWLLIGIFVCAGMAVMMFSGRFTASMQSASAANHAQMPPAAAEGVFVFMFLIMSIIFILIPAVWILVYGNRDTKATCEARDPVVRWTDRCPLPVLAVSIWQMFAAISMLFMPFCYHKVMPFFGMFLTGSPAMICSLLLAAIWGYTTYAVYKLDLRGWWTLVVCTTLLGISGAITYSFHDISEFYRLAGDPKQEAAMLSKSVFLTNNTMVWITLVSTVAWVGYLLYVRKFFPVTNKNESQPA